MSVTLQIPVVSEIANVIFARLRMLVSRSFGAYQFRDVVRPTKLATYTPVHGLVVFSRGSVERAAELDCPGSPPSVAWVQTFLIRVHIAPSERDDKPVDFYEEVAEAEIHRAVCSETNWHTFGDNAINAEFGPAVVVTSDGGYDGIAVPLMVTYRVEEGDPYTVRA